MVEWLKKAVFYEIYPQSFYSGIIRGFHVLMKPLHPKD